VKPTTDEEAMPYFNRANVPPEYTDDDIETLNMILEHELLADQIDEDDQDAVDRMAKYVLERMDGL